MDADILDGSWVNFSRFTWVLSGARNRRAQWHCSTRSKYVQHHILLAGPNRPTIGTHRRKTCLTHPVIARRLEGGLFGVLETCSIGLDSTMFRSTKSWQAPILREVRSTFILLAKAICTPRCWDVSSPTQVGIIPGRGCMSI